MPGVRRTMVKQQPVVRVARRQVPLHHAHGCDTCGRRFMDTCARPLEQRTCPTCRQGTVQTVEDRDRQPKQCCGTGSRLVTDVDTLSKYALAGHTSWFQCLTCMRCHPFDSTKEQD